MEDHGLRRLRLRVSTRLEGETCLAYALFVPDIRSGGSSHVIALHYCTYMRAHAACLRRVAVSAHTLESHTRRLRRVAVTHTLRASSGCRHVSESSFELKRP